MNAYVTEGTASSARLGENLDGVAAIKRAFYVTGVPVNLYFTISGFFPEIGRANV